MTGVSAYRRAASGDSPLQTPHRSTLPERHPATASQYPHRQRDEANQARSSAVSGTTNRIDSSLSPERVSDGTQAQRRLPQATQFTRRVFQNSVIIRGETAAIVLRRRVGEPLEALVDVSDLPALLPYRWIAAPYPNGMFYAVSSPRHSQPKQIRMHRLLLQPPADLEIDHIDHNGLNNRRKNIRIVTESQNQLNRRGPLPRSASGILGVYWHKRDQKWRARVMVEKRMRNLGTFDSRDDAAKAVAAFRAENGIACRLTRAVGDK